MESLTHALCDWGFVAQCKVNSPTDIYPVVMYDQTIVSSTAAGNTVLFGGK